MAQELSQEYGEEQQLTERIVRFLLKLRRGFAFVGRDYPVRVGGREDFSLDLLFYHLHLHCYIVIDLRLAVFQPEFASMMCLYLATVDDLLRPASDPATIGILVCQPGRRPTVDYVLRDFQLPVGISGYQLATGLSGELQTFLPTIPEWVVALNSSPD